MKRLILRFIPTFSIDLLLLFISVYSIANRNDLVIYGVVLLMMAILISSIHISDFAIEVKNKINLDKHV